MSEAAPSDRPGFDIPEGDGLRFILHHFEEDATLTRAFPSLRGALEDLRSVVALEHIALDDPAFAESLDEMRLDSSESWMGCALFALDPGSCAIVELDIMDTLAVISGQTTGHARLRFLPELRDRLAAAASGPA